MFVGLRRTYAVVAIIAALTTVTETAAQAAGVTPNICASQTGYIFDVTANHGLVLDGKGSPTIFHNGTSSSATLTLSQAGSGTVAWSVNGSLTATGGYDFMLIKASVAATVGGSYAQSKYASQYSATNATGSVPWDQQ